MEYYISESSQKVNDFNLNEVFARYYNTKGAKCADDGELNHALNFFNKALELSPTFVPALFNRATIKADLGDFLGAKNDFEEAKKLDQNDLIKDNKSYSITNPQH
jgi:tetratricopeptide (TPR) repeat protein